jgi:hypothetical protein
MPRFVVDDREYAISFKHHQVPVILGGKAVYTDATECVVLGGPVGSLDATKNVVGSAVAKRDTRDVPNRNAGRNLAFRQAIANLPRPVRAALGNGLKLRTKGLGNY